VLTDIRPIHTINARGNIFLEVMQEWTRADSHGMLLRPVSGRYASFGHPHLNSEQFTATGINSL